VASGDGHRLHRGVRSGATEKVGVGSPPAMRYAAEVTPLFVYPGAVAKACTVSEDATVTGPVYKLELVVGVVPSVV
jgi:hypothetical protein